MKSDLFFIIAADEILDIRQGVEVSDFEQLVGHISSVRPIDGVCFAVRCDIGLRSEACIHLMASDLLRDVLAVDIAAERIDGREIFHGREIAGCVSLVIVLDQVYLAVRRYMFARIGIGEDP